VPNSGQGVRNRTKERQKPEENAWKKRVQERERRARSDVRLRVKRDLLETLTGVFLSLYLSTYSSCCSKKEENDRKLLWRGRRRNVCCSSFNSEIIIIIIFFFFFFSFCWSFQYLPLFCFASTARLTKQVQTQRGFLRRILRREGNHGSRSYSRHDGRRSARYELVLTRQNQHEVMGATEFDRELVGAKR